MWGLQTKKKASERNKKVAIEQRQVEAIDQRIWTTSEGMPSEIGRSGLTRPTTLRMMSLTW